MNYAGIIYVDLANGPGIRTSLFVSGCRFGCAGCFNLPMQDHRYGDVFLNSTAERILGSVAKPYSSGLSILGGDPLWQSISGLCFLSLLCEDVHRAGKTVWLWTGFTWEDIWSNGDDVSVARQKLIENCDVVVDGPFIEDKKQLNLKWRGSTNQRIIDVKKTLEAGNITLWEDASCSI